MISTLISDPSWLILARSHMGVCLRDLPRARFFFSCSTRLTGGISSRHSESQESPLCNQIQAARARAGGPTCVRACVRAARSLRRGRRITCSRHMSPWVTPLPPPPLLIPLAHPQRIVRPPYGHVLPRQGFSAEQVAGVRVSGRVRVFFSLRPGTRDIPFLSWVWRITAQSIASAVRLSLFLSLSVSLFLFHVRRVTLPVTPSEVRSLV